MEFLRDFWDEHGKFIRGTSKVIIGVLLYAAVARASFLYLWNGVHDSWDDPTGAAVGAAVWPAAVPIVFAIRNYELVLIGAGGLIGLGVLGVGTFRVGSQVASEIGRKRRERAAYLSKKEVEALKEDGRLYHQELLADKALRQADPKLARELDRVRV